MFYQYNIQRRKSRRIMVGKVAVGGDAPISVQSMTNTDTLDVAATIKQVQQMQQAGGDLVRISVPTIDAVAAFAKIRAAVDIPLIADIHFDYKIALATLEVGVDCLRINPGNIGKEHKIREVVYAAKDKGVPMRIGVNAGSLEKDLQKKYGEPNPEALVESAMRNIDYLDKFDMADFKVSVKASDVMMAVEAYRILATKIEQPLHIGITEAGGMRNGSVKSAMGLGRLLMDGIGDTLRISLAADPVQEIKVGWDILKGLRIRNRGINLIACPGCSRQNFDVIKAVNKLETELEDIATPLDVAVIGCVVNGPGEAKESGVGLTGGRKESLIYIGGKAYKKVANDNIAEELTKLVRQEVAKTIATSK